tara:strand:+ start:428 stop:958 length:531 start_codon:yes stop_codon:yes gene_type:complete
MSVSRIRPSRQIVRTIIDVTKLPNAGAAAKSSTWKVENIPSRGIIHRCTILFTDGSAITASGENYKFLISTEGSATITAGGDAGVTATIAQSAILMTSLRTLIGAEQLAGSLFGDSFTVINNSSALGYDTNTNILGPNETAGVLFFTLSNDDSSATPYNWSAVTTARMFLEIEPCF